MRSPATPAHPSTTPPRGRYRVDPERSVVRFRTRHLFGLGGVTGVVPLRSAEITVGESMQDIAVRAVLDASGLDTGNPGRDRAVRSSAYLDSAAYPDIEFRADGSRLDAGGLVVCGQLTAHGVVAPLEVNLVALEQNGTEVSVRATATVDRYAHGVTAGRGIAGRRLRLELTAVAAPVVASVTLV